MIWCGVSCCYICRDMSEGIFQRPLGAGRWPHRRSCACWASSWVVIFFSDADAMKPVPQGTVTGFVPCHLHTHTNTHTAKAVAQPREPRPITAFSCPARILSWRSCLLSSLRVKCRCISCHTLLQSLSSTRSDVSACCDEGSHRRSIQHGSALAHHCGTAG